MFIATLLAAETLRAGDISDARDRLAATGLAVGNWAWIDEGEAADLWFEGDSVAARTVLEGAFDRTDVIVQPAGGREKKLIVADMDSTMITVECIDELADYAGIKPQIAEVTEAAMRGELDFAAALDARVALLEGLEESAIDLCLAERVRDSEGAATLIQTMRARGASSVLVSGGFTRFAEPVGARIGFDRVIANTLLVDAGRLTGTVGKPIIDASTKQSTLLAEAEALGIPRSATMAIGDGANDLAMIEASGLGVAYCAKPIVAAQADAKVDHADLTALLYFQGYRAEEFVTD